MGKTKDDVRVAFDHHTSARLLNADHAYAELRNRCPVAWTDAHDGYWVATSYAAADRVAKEHRTFSTTKGITIPPPPYGQTAMVDFDPPEHTAYRRALNPVLSQDAVDERLVPRIEYWADVLIDQIIERGEVDLMYDLAVPIPTAVTLEWLGWEQRDEWWPIGEAWHDLMGRGLTDPRFVRASEVVAWFDGRIAEELAARRAEPRDDVISHIAAIEIDGAVIPEKDQISLVRILVGAGVDTTTSLIGSALVHLSYHPEDRRRLREDPELWPTATEEFLRRYTPARTVARTCVAETELEGVTIRPGERVLAALSAGNQDADEFESPLTCVLDRGRNRHLSFGSGVHRCLGMHLARAEFAIVVRRVIERMPDYVVREDGLVEYARQSNITGWMTGPATFTPGPRMVVNAPDLRVTASAE